MMSEKVLITPQAQLHPLYLEPAEYDVLVQRKSNGWSLCEDATEYMAKLHYLREGFKAGKLTQEAFEDREKRLVLNWWRKGR